MDLEGDLEGEDGLERRMVARAAAPFGDADASTRVRDEGWVVYVTNGGKSAKGTFGTGVVSEWLWGKKDELKIQRMKETEYVCPRLKLCAELSASFVCVGSPSCDCSYATGHALVDVYFDLDTDSIHMDAFSGGL